MVAEAAWPLSRTSVLARIASWDTQAFWSARSPPAVVDVGDEVAAQFIHQVQEGMAVEVDPDEGAGGAALAVPGCPGIDPLQGVDGSFLAGHAVGHGLNFGKRELSDLTTDIRTGQALAPGE